MRISPSRLIIARDPSGDANEENIERHSQLEILTMQNRKMRYEYTVTKEGGEAEIMKAMSWKKLFKSLLLKYPKFSGWCTYMNKKGHLQQRSFKNGKEYKYVYKPKRK